MRVQGTTAGVSEFARSFRRFVRQTGHCPDVAPAEPGIQRCRKLRVPPPATDTAAGVRVHPASRIRQCRCAQPPNPRRKTGRRWGAPASRQLGPTSCRALFPWQRGVVGAPWQITRPRMRHAGHARQVKGGWRSWLSWTAGFQPADCAVKERHRRRATGWKCVFRDRQDACFPSPDLSKPRLGRRAEQVQFPQR
jgi:hypothetical protein